MTVRIQAMLTLYTFHNSICTQKVFMTLAEKDLSYDEHLVAVLHDVIPRGVDKEGDSIGVRDLGLRIQVRVRG